MEETTPFSSINDIWHARSTRQIAVFGHSFFK